MVVLGVPTLPYNFGFPMPFSNLLTHLGQPASVNLNRQLPLKSRLIHKLQPASQSWPPFTTLALLASTSNHPRRPNTSNFHIILPVSSLCMALRASLSATSIISYGQLAKLSAGAPVSRAGILHCGSSKCRIAHSLSTSCTRRRPTARRRAIRMEEAAIVTPTTLTGEADALTDDEDDEGPILLGPTDVSEYVALLKRAAKTKKVPPIEVFAAIKAIEKAKVDPSNFLEALGGTQSPGRTWMLVFTTNETLVREALSGGPGGGQYLPVSAIQNFDAAAMRLENGVYLGPLGAFAFEGRFSWKKRILAFIFDKIKIKIGILPAFTINIGKKEDEGRTPSNADPFFIWFYADDEIIVAKGRGGGVAFWCRCKRVQSDKF